LAGSSAIVIGVLRALYRSTQHPLPHHLPLASMALGVETRGLGITAGMQDRLVQAYGRPVLMRFDPHGEFDLERAPGADRPSAVIVEPGTDFRLLVAHRGGWSEPSQVVHGDLRRRFAAGDHTVRRAMSQLLAHAISAGSAFAAGNAELLGASMDATYDLRASMIDLSPGHVEMIEAARSAGASANYTGSGGAIAVLSSSDEIETATRQSLKSLGCEIVPVDAGPGTP
jgi:glucuronokinase